MLRRRASSNAARDRVRVGDVGRVRRGAVELLRGRAHLLVLAIEQRDARAGRHEALGEARPMPCAAPVTTPGAAVEAAGHGAHVRPAVCSSPAASRSRSSRLRTLPVGLRGSASRNRKPLGVLYFARRSRQNASSSSALDLGAPR